MVGLHLCMWVFCVVCYALFERFTLLFQPSIAMQLPSHIDILTFACPLISALNADYHIVSSNRNLISISSSLNARWSRYKTSITFKLLAVIDDGNGRIRKSDGLRLTST